MTLKERIHADAPFSIGVLSVDLAPDALAARVADEDWDLAFVDLQHMPYTEPQLVAFCGECAEFADEFGGRDFGLFGLVPVLFPRLLGSGQAGLCLFHLIGELLDLGGTGDPLFVEFGGDGIG